VVRVTATSPSTLALTGTYEAQMPRFATINRWSPTTTDAKVIWDGKVFNYVSGAKSDVPGLSSTWAVSTLTADYSNEVHSVDYDLKSDTILARRDSLGNSISQSLNYVQTTKHPDPIESFEWGDATKNNNTVTDSTLVTINKYESYSGLIVRNNSKVDIMLRSGLVLSGSVFDKAVLVGTCGKSITKLNITSSAVTYLAATDTAFNPNKLISGVGPFLVFDQGAKLAYYNSYNQI
jgi:hypothetical protein